MSVVGQKIMEFDIPVCNKFIPHMLEGQLCYQLDVKDVKDQVDFKKAVKHGLVFAMDYNEDKMFTERVDPPLITHLEQHLWNEEQNLWAPEARIYIETIGRILIF